MQKDILKQYSDKELIEIVECLSDETISQNSLFSEIIDKFYPSKPTMGTWHLTNLLLPEIAQRLKKSNNLLNAKQIEKVDKGFYGRKGGIVACKECGKTITLESDFFIEHGVLCDRCSH